MDQNTPRLFTPYGLARGEEHLGPRLRREVSAPGLGG